MLCFLSNRTCILFFPAGIFGETTLYKITRHDAILPCARASSSNTTCSSVSWLYNRDVSHTFSEILHGNVIKASARAARLDLDTKCSLVITSITAEDAGLYTCRQGRNSNRDVRTHLSVLSSESNFCENLLRFLSGNSAFGTKMLRCAKLYSLFPVHYLLAASLPNPRRKQQP